MRENVEIRWIGAVESAIFVIMVCVLEVGELRCQKYNATMNIEASAELMYVRANVDVVNLVV